MRKADGIIAGWTTWQKTGNKLLNFCSTAYQQQHHSKSLIHCVIPLSNHSSYNTPLPYTEPTQNTSNWTQQILSSYSPCQECMSKELHSSILLKYRMTGGIHHSLVYRTKHTYIETYNWHHRRGRAQERSRLSIYIYIYI